jgi:hypothetical protein
MSPLPLPPNDPTTPIPNQPFSSPDTEYIEGAYSPVIIGEGLTIDGDYIKVTANNTSAITSNTTFYVATTGSDTEGDGSQDNPWATPHKAMEVLSRFTIWDDVQVIIQCAEGTYNFTIPLGIDYPYGKQVVIQGVVNGGRPNLPDLTSAGFGYNAATKANNFSVLSGVYKTVFSFDQCNGVEAFNVSGVTLNDLLIASASDTDNTAGVCAGVVVSKAPSYSPSYVTTPSTAQIHLGNVAIFGFKMAGILAVGGTVLIDPVSGIVCGCGDNGGYFGGGFLALSNGLISPSNTYVVNNQWGWAAAEGGAISGAPSFIYGNQNGIYVAVDGVADITSGNANNNVDVVLKIANGGNIRAQYVNAFTPTTGNFAEANGAGFMDLRGANLDPGAVLDPPADTIGNGLCFLRTV